MVKQCITILKNLYLLIIIARKNKNSKVINNHSIVIY